MLKFAGIIKKGPNFNPMQFPYAILKGNYDLRVEAVFTTYHVLPLVFLRKFLYILKICLKLNDNFMMSPMNWHKSYKLSSTVPCLNLGHVCHASGPPF